MSTITLEPRRVLEFTRPTTMTPQQARRWTQMLLNEWQESETTVAAAGLVVTELVTNAAVHGPSDGVITLSVRRVSAGIEIGVSDPGRIPPEQWTLARDGLDEHGRGLTLVRALTVSFDVEMHRFGGKTVSAVIGNGAVR